MLAELIHLQLEKRKLEEVVQDRGTSNTHHSSITIKYNMAAAGSTLTRDTFRSQLRDMGVEDKI